MRRAERAPTEDSEAAGWWHVALAPISEARVWGEASLPQPEASVAAPRGPRCLQFSTHVPAQQLSTQECDREPALKEAPAASGPKLRE